jgi:hypothetical protein
VVRWAQYPELRRRLSGTGTPKYEVLADVPTFWCGVPAAWLKAHDLRTWPAIQAEAYDPDDPPVYEAQAVYLERHGLLLPGEKRLLRKADHEPEPVVFETSAEADH